MQISYSVLYRHIIYIFLIWAYGILSLMKKIYILCGIDYRYNNSAYILLSKCRLEVQSIEIRLANGLSKRIYQIPLGHLAPVHPLQLSKTYSKIRHYTNVFVTSFLVIYYSQNYSWNGALICITEEIYH